jgi:hypothetical protein
LATPAAVRSEDRALAGDYQADILNDPIECWIPAACGREWNQETSLRFAPKGPNISAQGNALGKYVNHSVRAL